MSDKLIDLSVRDLLDRFASSDPTPGGGSASALAGAVGASLLMMVAMLPRTRQNTPAERDILAGAVGALRGCRDDLSALVDADTDAYRMVIAAYRQPKATDEEQRARAEAIQRALGGATETPLAMMRAAAAALEQAVVVARHGNPSAASDVKVAVMLLRQAAAGARSNVEINLDRFTDGGFATRMQAEARDLDARAEAHASAALLQV